MHNNFITHFMNLLDLVTTDLIKTTNIFFIVDYQINHVKSHIFYRNADKVNNRRVQFIQDVFIKIKNDTWTKNNRK